MHDIVLLFESVNHYNLLADGLNSDSITNLKNPAPFGDDFGSEILYIFANDKYP
jgi:hypothetical protein